MRVSKTIHLVILLWLLSCKTTLVYKVTSERIDLDYVKMITPAEAPKNAENEGRSPETLMLAVDPYVNIEYSETNKPFIQLELYFKGSGLNIIEEIKNGNILEHKIVVKNQKGETISAQPVNYQAYEVTETKIEKVTNKVVIGDSQEKFKLADLGKESKSYKESQPIRYTDDNSIPQALAVDPNKVPSSGEYIIIFLEISYVNPFLEGTCDEINLDCERDKVIIFRSIKERNRIKLESSKENKATVNGSPKTEEVGTLSVFRDLTHNYEGNKYFYREWNLVSNPRFFKIQSIVKNAKPENEDVKVEEEKKLPIQQDNKAETDKEIKTKIEKSENVFDKPHHPIPIRKKKIIYTP